MPHIVTIFCFIIIKALFQALQKKFEAQYANPFWGTLNKLYNWKGN